MARDFQTALKRHEELHLSRDEVAFYDALAERPEVLEQMGDATLKQLTTELTAKLRASTTVDWQPVVRIPIQERNPKDLGAAHRHERAFKAKGPFRISRKGLGGTN
jgi:hypothetical protein